MAAIYTNYEICESVCKLNTKICVSTPVPYVQVQNYFPPPKEIRETMAKGLGEGTGLLILLIIFRIEFIYGPHASYLAYIGHLIVGSLIPPLKARSSNFRRPMRRKRVLRRRMMRRNGGSHRTIYLRIIRRPYLVHIQTDFSHLA